MAYYELNKSQKFLEEFFSFMKSSSKVYALHLCKNTLTSVKPLRALLSNSRKPFKKGLTLNFSFCKQNRTNF